MDAPGSATSEAAGPDPARRRRGLAAIIACIAIYGVVLGLTSPLLSLILEARGIDSTIIGLNAATPALAMLLIAPFAPAIIQRAGFRLAILASLAIEGVVLLLFPAFPGLAAWFVFTETQLYTATTLVVLETAEKKVVNLESVVATPTRSSTACTRRRRWPSAEKARSASSDRRHE